MRHASQSVLTLVIAFSCAGPVQGQEKPQVPDSGVVKKSIKAVGYEVGGGSTKVIFVGTPGAPNASGEAKVEAKKGRTDIEVKVKGLPQPSTLGAEFLTYVLWTVTPDGSTTNLGEIPIDKNGEGKLNTSAQSQTFAMGVTAEPYFAVSLPSEIVVLVNDTTKNTKGKIYPENSYRLIKRTEYAKLGNPLALTLDLKNVPLDMYEARNAVDIARSKGAEKYAPEIFSKASGSLQMAENALASNSDKSKIVTDARQTIQFAEDARALASERREAERIQAEKDAAAAAAKAKAEEQAAAEAKRQAELTAAKEAQMKAEADKAQAEAEAKQAAEKARAQAATEEAERARAATAALRSQLLQQLNTVLQTSDSPRGLVVNMADVLFDFGKYDLKPDAKIKLAKLAGIIQAHPGLHLAIEGHTDSIGSDEANMKLSQQRAEEVRNFLVQQELTPDTVTAVGLGKAEPVADNGTNDGRQKNRRVEIIVSGEMIGVKLG
ncbi:MAG TPA: OmpA family protein [Terriglobales bacterium]|jgi:outer membrane protein OmpA-like peptidoglycan-associated protein|nr:OmpA family protein [Terriglobales bacterium]